MTNSSAGQAVTAEIRKMWQIGPRTKWGRKTGRLVEIEWILRELRETIGDYRGIESERRTAVLDKAHTALYAYGKFVDGYRIDGVLRFHITTATPLAWAAFLGEMVDSGCTNMGEFEQWFTQQARELHAAQVAA